MKKTIVLLGTLDTKGPEFSYINEHIRQRGFDTIVVDAGVRGSPLLEPDISHDEVAAAAGATVEELAAPGGGEAMVETITLGRPKGSALIAAVAIDVPSEPPTEIIPSSFPER